MKEKFKKYSRNIRHIKVGWLILSGISLFIGGVLTAINYSVAYNAGVGLGMFLVYFVAFMVDCWITITILDAMISLCDFAALKVDGISDKQSLKLAGLDSVYCLYDKDSQSYICTCECVDGQYLYTCTEDNLNAKAFSDIEECEKVANALRNAYDLEFEIIDYYVDN